MTGADLTEFRWAWCMGSTKRLAARLGCHVSTIYRNEKRETVTPYVALLIEQHDTAQRFLDGMQWGRDERELQRRIAA